MQPAGLPRHLTHLEDLEQGFHVKYADAKGHSKNSWHDDEHQQQSEEDCQGNAQQVNHQAIKGQQEKHDEVGEQQTRGRQKEATWSAQPVLLIANNCLARPAGPWPIVGAMSEFTLFPTRPRLTKNPHDPA